MTMNEDDQELALYLKVNHFDVNISEAACSLSYSDDKREVQNNPKIQFNTAAGRCAKNSENAKYRQPCWTKTCCMGDAGPIKQMA